MSLQTISKEDERFPCIFCKNSVIDALSLGPMYMFDGVVTHYYCMLFSAALSQNGGDAEGILGFLPDDVMKEVRRSQRLKCSHCQIVGASVGCCNRKCRQVFHFPCGLHNQASYQFFGNYESFCKEHGKAQKITVQKQKHSRDWNCPICMNKVSNNSNGSDKPIMTSCCKAAVFHKECMQNMALNAGYFFKCPTCNAGESFKHEMRSLGIFVPEQDASWEREPNAYQDLLYKYSRCDAPKCKCSKGREYMASKGNWLLARCRICGAAGMHKQCGKLDNTTNWACDGCLVVEKKVKIDRKLQQEQKSFKEKTIVRKSGGARNTKRSSEQSEERPHVSARGRGSIRAKSSSANVNKNRRSKPEEQQPPVVKQQQQHQQNEDGDEEDDDDDEPFKLADVVISDSCYYYFPYNRDILETFDNDACLPDWRKLTLSVNVMDWITHTPNKEMLFTNSVSGEAASSSCSSRGIRTSSRFRGNRLKSADITDLTKNSKSSSPVVNKKLMNVPTQKTYGCSENIPGGEDEIQSIGSGTVINYSPLAYNRRTGMERGLREKKRKHVKKFRKKSMWMKGVVKKKKKVKKPKDDLETADITVSCDESFDLDVQQNIVLQPETENYIAQVSLFPNNSDDNCEEEDLVTDSTNMTHAQRGCLLLSNNNVIDDVNTIEGSELKSNFHSINGGEVENGVGEYNPLVKIDYDHDHQYAKNLQETSFQVSIPTTPAIGNHLLSISVNQDNHKSTLHFSKEMAHRFFLKMSSHLKQIVHENRKRKSSMFDLNFDLANMKRFRFTELQQANNSNPEYIPSTEWWRPRNFFKFMTSSKTTNEVRESKHCSEVVSYKDTTTTTTTTTMNNNNEDDVFHPSGIENSCNKIFANETEFDTFHVSEPLVPSTDIQLPLSIPLSLLQSVPKITKND